jgi:hypothetical protein
MPSGQSRFSRTNRIHRSAVNFYHSFPRFQNQGDHQYGLNVLDSILRIGLLITPELRIVAGYKNLGPIAYLQK